MRDRSNRRHLSKTDVQRLDGIGKARSKRQDRDKIFVGATSEWIPIETDTISIPLGFPVELFCAPFGEYDFFVLVEFT